MRALAASAAGMTDVLASAPYEATWLQWFGFVLLLRALDGLPVRQAILVGGAGGFATSAALFTWLIAAVERLGGVPRPAAIACFVIFCAWAAGAWALLGAVDARLRAAAPGWRWLFFPPAFVACEHVWPQLFCWTSGVPQVASPLVAQAADLGGAALLGYVLLTANVAIDAALAWVIARARGELGRSPRAPIAWGLTVVAACLAYGAWRLPDVRQGPELVVALAQPVVTNNVLTRRSELEVLSGLRDQADEIGRGPSVDLALFPESALPRVLFDVDLAAASSSPIEVQRQLELERQARQNELVDLAARCRAPVLAGGVWWLVRPGQSLETSTAIERRNATFLALSHELRARHDKHTLLVFGEYLPGERLAPWLRDVLPFAGVFTPGDVPVPLELPATPAASDLRVGSLICYEAVPSGPARHLARTPGGLDLLVAPTNDVWFDGTAGPHLHAMLVRLRAIETRRALVRAAMTGRTFAVDRDGAVVSELPLGVAAVVRATVHRPPDRTSSPLYVHAGDAFAWATVGLILVLLTRLRGRSPR